MISCRGIRGATTVEENTKEAILRETRRLLALMIKLNGIKPDDVTSAIFSTTLDLNAEYPALAARQLGWLNVAIICTHEMDVPDGLKQCVRILLHWNTEKSSDEIKHVYIKDAKDLRPDQSDLSPVDYKILEEWIEKQLSTWKNHQENIK